VRTLRVGIDNEIDDEGGSQLMQVYNGCNCGIYHPETSWGDDV